MIAAVGKLDLVNNVFQNGVHGSLRNTLVDVRFSRSSNMHAFRDSLLQPTALYSPGPEQCPACHKQV